MRCLPGLFFPVLGLLAGCGSAAPPVPVGGFLVPSEGRIVELSHALDAGSFALPGQPGFERLAPPGDRAPGRLCVGETTGTHLVAPAWWEAGAAGIGDLSPRQLVGPLVVLDQSEAAGFAVDTQLQMADVETWERRNGEIPPGAIVAVRSGWSRFYGTDGYWNADASGVPHFPGVSEAVARFLVAQRRILGVLVETPRLEAGGATDAAARVLAEANKFVVLNASGLDGVPPLGTLVFVGPLFAVEAPAAPVRVFALVPRSAAQTP